MRHFLVDVVWWIDDTIFKLHKKLFPKHLRRQIERNPDKVSFLTSLGFKILGW